MISFPCKCGEIVEVPDDQAGLTAQCPHCGLLRDVPTLSDLRHLTGDGTYELEPNPEVAQEHRIEELRRAFSYERTDDEGDEIDLRPTMSEVKKAGYIEEQEDDAAPALPKYDPVSGELVEPIQVEPVPDPREIPMARRLVGYATSQTQSAHFSAAKIFLELLQPVNVVVMFFIILAHAFAEFLACIPLLLFLIPILFAILTMIVAHYAIVVEEVGIEERDELPRPLRQFEFGADLFWPFMHVVGALMVCFAPAYFVATELENSRYQMLGFLAMVIIGFVFLPAALLTFITSGTIRNLRPDRLVGVMYEAGVRYLLAVFLFPAVGALYYFGIAGSRLALLHMMGFPIHISWQSNPMFAFPALVLAIYMMHYSCWYLGLIYRDFHDVFPWVFQRHIPTRLMERTRT